MQNMHITLYLKSVYLPSDIQLVLPNKNFHMNTIKRKSFGTSAHLSFFHFPPIFFNCRLQDSFIHLSRTILLTLYSIKFQDVEHPVLFHAMLKVIHN